MSHEWAYIKTRWTRGGNGVRVLRCMHCRCEKHHYHHGTSGILYHMPGNTLGKAMPECKR